MLYYIICLFVRKPSSRLTGSAKVQLIASDTALDSLME